MLLKNNIYTMKVVKTFEEFIIKKDKAKRKDKIFQKDLPKKSKKQPVEIPNWNTY